MSIILALIVGTLPLAQAAPLPHLNTLENGLLSPARIAMAPDRSILVTDPEAGKVIRFDASGAHTGSWSMPDGPLGIAVHPDGRVFVSMRDAPGVAIFDADFQLIGSLGADDPAVTFVQPTDVDIATDTGRIYVVDADGDRIYGFEPDGSLALLLGTRGHLPGAYLYPSAIAVDEARGRLIVADHDMYRMQVFTTGGVFLFQFGGRLETPTTGSGLTPRPQGLDVSGDGHIYVSDALMSTVRVFDSAGNDLGVVATYGLTPGTLRNPCDLALTAENDKLYVANVGNGCVEVFATSDVGVAAASTPTQPPPGTGGATRLTQGVRNGPHLVADRLNFCQPCHGITGQPGNSPGTPEGQAALCASCHNAGGRALNTFVHSHNMADPYGTNAGADGKGSSHAWDVPAVGDQEEWSRPGYPMSAYLGPNDTIKCSTCHNQHDTETHTPYLRISNDGDALCKSCHDARVKGIGEPGSHPVGILYPAGEDAYPHAADVAPLLIKEGQVECMTCHDVHDANSGGANDGAGDGMLLRQANDETLCTACHTEHAIHYTESGWQPTCSDCHDVHDVGSENNDLIARSIEGVQVAFTAPASTTEGPFDYIHGQNTPASYDGVCEACHTATSYHRNSPDGDHDHYTDLPCTACHIHSGGFAPMENYCYLCHGEPPNGQETPNRTGSHDVHFTAAHGPHVEECETCHKPQEADTHDNGVVNFASGVDANGDGRFDLDETDVCNECHSPGGTYDGVHDPIIGAKANWYTGVYVDNLLPEEKANWCLGCHDTGDAIVHEVAAPTVAGDSMSWGYNIAGHGVFHVLCTECHDSTMAHSDGIATSFSARFPLMPGGGFDDDREAYNNGYRLKRFDGQWALTIPRPLGDYDPGMFRLCFDCHDEGALMGVPANYEQFPPVPEYLQRPAGVAVTNHRNESEWGFDIIEDPVNSHWRHIAPDLLMWDVDHNGQYIDSCGSCVMCHNPHGTQHHEGGATIAMTKADLGIGYGVYDDGETLWEYGYLGSSEWLSAGGDLFCRSCHLEHGQGEDPPSTEEHARYYRQQLNLWGDDCWACHDPEE